MVSKFLFATALLIAVCGCIPQTDDPDLVGGWAETGNILG